MPGHGPSDQSAPDRAALPSPNIAVIIACYNYGRFLGEAIESALAQTLAAHEIIVVDDGSSDDTAAVAARYPVKLVRQENAGVCRARNAGAKLATSDYLVFLDADDRLKPTYLARCWQALAKAPAHVAYAYSAMQLFGAEQGVFPSKAFEPKALLAGNFVNVSALLDARVFADAGGFDPSWTLGYEDYELWLRLLARGFHGVLVPDVLLEYRRHGPARNTLSRAELQQLTDRLFREYLSLYWRDFFAKPVQSLQRLWRVAGRSKSQRALDHPGSVQHG